MHAVKSETCALIVDDDRPIRGLLKLTFKRHGIECDEAEDGSVAIERLRAKTYEVVLLDLMMPKVDGFQVIKFIEREKPETPVLVMSATSQSHLSKLSSPVVRDIVRKPFDLNAVTVLVLEICGLPVPADLRG